jgi:hypothetical protein
MIEGYFYKFRRLSMEITSLGLNLDNIQLQVRSHNDQKLETHVHQEKASVVENLSPEKLNGRYIREEFLSYQESSSLDKTGSYLAPFVTQIGLYQDGLLVAVAKLGKPVKSDGSYPITFNVKYDSF